MEIFGESVTESTAKAVGRMALRSTMTGSVSGSVTGLVAMDSIKGAVKSGKKSRGATEEDRYKFGDITRGAIRAVKQTSKKGAMLDRGESDGYQVRIDRVRADHVGRMSVLLLRRCPCTHL